MVSASIVRSALTSVVVSGLLSGAAQASPAGAELSRAHFVANVEAGGRYEPGTLTVKVDPSLKAPALKALARKHGCEWDHQFGKWPYHVVNCPPERQMERLITEVASEAGVQWVEAGFYDELEATPNDLFELQWYHNNVGQAVDMVNGRPGADLSSLDAWEVTTGSPARVIAIIDIGIFTGHLDLAPQEWTNPAEVCGNGQDDDNNGYVDDCHGWDIGENDNDASPLTLPEMAPDGGSCLRWHATYIAGLAAAQGNNNLGLAGGAWDASIMNLKRHRDSTCQGTSGRAAEAVLYAVDNGADVLGFSFNTTTNSMALSDALAVADMQGVIAVMSAGNGGSNINGSTRYPNNYPMVHKIITGSSNNLDQLDPASNYGTTKVDMAMPGTYVVSTAIEDSQAYGVGTGTSMAVGFGLAAVALGKTAFPMASSSQIMAAMISGGAPLTCSSSTRCVRTGKRLDFLGMLRDLSPMSPASLSLSAVSTAEVGNNDGKVGPGERALPQFTVSNGGPGGAFGLRGSLRVVSGQGLSSQAPSLPFGSVAAGQSLTPSVYLPALEVASGCTTDFDAQVELTVTDVLGHSAVAPWTVAVRCVGAMPPPDAGVVEDAGPVVDTGTGPAPDAGQPMEDSGLTPRDSGVHPDSGVTPRDSGVHPDAGETTEPPTETASGCQTGKSGPGGLGWMLMLGALIWGRRRRG